MVPLDSCNTLENGPYSLPEQQSRTGPGGRGAGKAASLEGVRAGELFQSLTRCSTLQSGPGDLTGQHCGHSGVVGTGSHGIRELLLPPAYGDIWRPSWSSSGEFALMVQERGSQWADYLN